MTTPEDKYIASIKNTMHNSKWADKAQANPDPKRKRRKRKGSQKEHDNLAAAGRHFVHEGGWGAAFLVDSATKYRNGEAIYVHTDPGVTDVIIVLTMGTGIGRAVFADAKRRETRDTLKMTQEAAIARVVKAGGWGGAFHDLAELEALLRAAGGLPECERG